MSIVRSGIGARVRHLACAVTLALTTTPAHAQTLYDDALTFDVIVEGLGTTFPTFATSFVFVDDDTLLVANRADGTIVRVDLIAGSVATPGPVVLDLDVIHAVPNSSNSEYGVQGLALHPDFASNGWIYVRYDRSITAGQDTIESDVWITIASIPTDNVIERYVWNPDANGGDGAMLFDAAIHTIVHDTKFHHGGGVVFGLDGMLYAAPGDLRRTGVAAWEDETAGPLASVNLETGVIDDLAVVLRLHDDGAVPRDNPFDASDPDVPAGTERWFAYGLRNSFGLAVDPVTGALWETENCEALFDEINLIPAGFNGGWRRVMGPPDHPLQTGSLDDLWVLPGSAYHAPKFTWLDTVGVTGLHFLHGSGLGAGHDDRVLVGVVNQGFVFSMRLNANRDGFLLTHPEYDDFVDDRKNPLVDPIGTPAEEIVLGTGFGTTFRGVIAIEPDPNGLPCLLTGGDGRIYRLRRRADVNADGAVSTDDLLQLLATWGPCPGCPTDLDGDGAVNVSDLLGVLAAWD